VHVLSRSGSSAVLAFRAHHVSNRLLQLVRPKLAHARKATVRRVRRPDVHARLAFLLLHLGGGLLSLLRLVVQVEVCVHLRQRGVRFVDARSQRAQRRVERVCFEARRAHRDCRRGEAERSFGDELRRGTSRARACTEVAIPHAAAAREERHGEWRFDADGGEYRRGEVRADADRDEHSAQHVADAVARAEQGAGKRDSERELRLNHRHHERRVQRAAAHPQQLALRHVQSTHRCVAPLREAHRLVRRHDALILRQALHHDHCDERCQLHQRERLRREEAPAVRRVDGRLEGEPLKCAEQRDCNDPNSAEEGDGRSARADAPARCPRRHQ
jgi:hypothetical protein